MPSRLSLGNWTREELHSEIRQNGSGTAGKLAPIEMIPVPELAKKYVARKLSRKTVMIKTTTSDKYDRCLAGVFDGQRIGSKTSAGLSITR
ncbi:MAG: hypothetical protein Q8R76_01320 [Candidatus Omnitrophota bacterium]|nr:hypothetical protein [Candidatus Omnitrophota bacterium]